MYFISNSMAKSASTLLCDLTKKSVIASFGSEGQKALIQAITAGELLGWGGFIANCSNVDVLAKLRVLSNKYGPFVVKTHAPLTDDLRHAIENGDARVSYIYRDPRDAMLSAMSNYESTKSSNRVEFKEFDTLDAALIRYVDIAKHAVTWKESGLAAILRYEEFVNDIEGELKNCLQELGLVIPHDLVTEFVASAKASQEEKEGWNLRFNIGISGRFRQELTPTDLKKSTMALDISIRALGYAS